MEGLSKRANWIGGSQQKMVYIASVSEDSFTIITIKESNPVSRRAMK